MNRLQQRRAGAPRARHGRKLVALHVPAPASRARATRSSAAAPSRAARCRRARLGIGMAYIPAERAEVGDGLEIDVRGKRATAVVASEPLCSRGDRWLKPAFPTTCSTAPSTRGARRGRRRRRSASRWFAAGRARRGRLLRPARGRPVSHGRRVLRRARVRQGGLGGRRAAVGQIVEVNTGLADTPEAFLEDPSGEGSMVQGQAVGAAETDGLLDCDSYVGRVLGTARRLHLGHPPRTSRSCSRRSRPHGRGLFAAIPEGLRLGRATPAAGTCRSRPSPPTARLADPSVRRGRDRTRRADLRQPTAADACRRPGGSSSAARRSSAGPATPARTAPSCCSRPATRPPSGRTCCAAASCRAASPRATPCAWRSATRSTATTSRSSATRSRPASAGRSRRTPASSVPTPSAARARRAPRRSSSPSGSPAPASPARATRSSAAAR